jgi:hypothetical protein
VNPIARDCIQVRDRRDHGGMLPVNTTVVAVVAPPGVSPLEGARAANVRVLRPDPDTAVLERARAVWEQARRTTTSYLLHDADPLGWVADAWAARFEGRGAVGDLEVAVSETVARWRARNLDLPDYYLIVHPEDLRPVLRHWYLGVLGGAAPARVRTASASRPVIDQLDGLPTGPWWPPVDRLVTDIDHILPEQAGGSGAATGSALITR